LRAEGLEVQWLEIDVTNEESVATAVRMIGSVSSHLDVLANNAGGAINYDRPPSEQAMADIKATYEVNVFGPMRVTRAFLALLLAAPAARKSGA
jgi:NAD(P)-dependent dehydrogenase (short-subunit alcohol dehydrogenase family)